jgi:hypothetical protein
VEGGGGVSGMMLVPGTAGVFCIVSKSKYVIRRPQNIRTRTGGVSETVGVIFMFALGWEVSILIGNDERGRRYVQWVDLGIVSKHPISRDKGYLRLALRASPWSSSPAVVGDGSWRRRLPYPSLCASSTNLLSLRFPRACACTGGKG